MNVYSAILRRRSIRRFKNQPVSESTLFKFVDAARLAPSAGNHQPLEYITVSSAEGCNQLFPLLKWARYIDEGDAPPLDKRPAAYILILINRNIISKGGGHDVGAAAQNIILAALEEGLGSCWIRTMDRNAVKETFSIPDHVELDSVIALGKASESPITEIAHKDAKYWRDDRSLMHVPKRILDSILHKEKY